MAKILVVDDDSTFCLMLKTFLDNMSHRVNIVSIAFATQAGSFQRYGATTGKGVKHPGHMV